MAAPSSSVYTEPIEWDIATPISAQRLNELIGQTSAGVGGNQSALYFGHHVEEGSALTLDTGEITLSGGFGMYTLDTEGSVVLDELDTINGGVEGDIVAFRIAAPARHVRLMDGTGNLDLGQDILLYVIKQIVHLRFDGTNWTLLYDNFNQERVPGSTFGLGSLVINSVVETSIYSITIPAGLLSVGRLFTARIFGFVFNNSGVAGWWKLRLKYGATTLLTTFPDIANVNAIQYFEIMAQLAGAGATNSQRGGVVSSLGINVDNALTNVNTAWADAGTSAEDSETDLTFDVTMEMQAAHANASFRRHAAHARLSIP